MSGKQEKALLAYSDEEITQCVILPNASIIFMLGWCKRILAYKNTSAHKKVFLLFLIYFCFFLKQINNQIILSSSLIVLTDTNEV